MHFFHLASLVLNTLYRVHPRCFRLVHVCSQEVPLSLSSNLPYSPNSLNAIAKREASLTLNCSEFSKMIFESWTYSEDDSLCLRLTIKQVLDLKKLDYVDKCSNVIVASLEKRKGFLFMKMGSIVSFFFFISLIFFKFSN